MSDSRSPHWTARLGRFGDFLFLLPLLGCAVIYGNLRDFSFVSLNVMSCFQLAGPFAAAMVVMAGFAFTHDFGQALPRKERKLMFGIGFAGCLAGTLYILGRYKPELSLPITRFWEAAALSTVGCVVLIMIFLIASGWLEGRRILASLRRLGSIWGGFCVYQLLAGFCLTFLVQMTPEVVDPTLMRMDLSFGFLPSWNSFQASQQMPWLHWVNEWGYPLLGFLISFIAFRFHIAKAYDHARRCLLAVLAVGTLGIACYWMVPAVGPIFVYGEVLHSPVASLDSDQGAAVVKSITEGPEKIEGYSDLSRNVFPSLHTAFTLVVLIAAWSWRRGFFWLCLPLGIVQIATTMTKGVHYAVDLVAAFPLAALCWWMADWLLSARYAQTAPASGLAKWIEEHRKQLSMGFFSSVALSFLALYFWHHQAPIAAPLAYGLSALIVTIPFSLGMMLVRKA